MEFLECSQEEWQLCQIVCNFVKENRKEVESETCDFFWALTCSAKSLVCYCTALSKKFQPPEALQVFLLARVCNAHMCMFFKDHIWSTVASNLSFYVAMNLAVVGMEFVALCSHEEETIECVVGEIRMLVEGDVQHVEHESDQSSSDIDSCMGDEHMLEYTDAESEMICDKLQLDCEVCFCMRPSRHCANKSVCLLNISPCQCCIPAMFSGVKELQRVNCFQGMFSKENPHRTGQLVQCL